MIEVNLAPIEEIENKLWFLPELLIAAAAFAFSNFATEYYLKIIEESIITTQAETQEFKESQRRLKPDLERYKKLGFEVENLKKKLEALKQITVSKIARYKPIILLEHMQNLKPEGVWLNLYQDESDNSIVRIVGGAFDTLLISEFMSSLSSTAYQEVDKSDFRSQVYFSDLYLDRVATPKAITTSENVLSSKDSIAFRKTQDKNLTEAKGTSYWSSSLKFFPEMSKYPGFEINLKYAERKIIEQITPIQQDKETR